jgi:putative zinc finger protein
MSCEFAHHDGAYVLGALSPAERQEFERHLETCPACARAVRELAGLPGLLSRVDVDVLEAPAPYDPVPDTLLASLVREVRRSQRRRMLVSSGLAAAVVAAVTVASLALTGVVGGDRQSADSHPTTSVSLPAFHAMKTVGGAPVTGKLSFESVAWGTRLGLVCSYTAGSSRYGEEESATYALVVRTRDGQDERVATWRGVPGQTMRVPAATAMARADIASVEVRTEGRPVLRLG